MQKTMKGTGGRKRLVVEGVVRLLQYQDAADPENGVGPKAARRDSEVQGGDRTDLFTLPRRSCPDGNGTPSGSVKKGKAVRPADSPEPTTGPASLKCAVSEGSVDAAHEL